MIALFGVRFAALGVLTAGLAQGAEIQLIAYFVSRYFGLRAQGTIFGWCYGMVALAGMCSPVLLGFLRDHQGGYGVAMGLVIAGLAAAAVLCPLLGPFRYETGEGAHPLVKKR